MAGRNTSRVTLALGLAVGITVFLAVTIGSILGQLGSDGEGGTPVAVAPTETVLGVSITAPAKELPSTEGTSEPTVPPATTTTTDAPTTTDPDATSAPTTTSEVGVETSVAGGPALLLTGPASVDAGSVAEFCLAGSPEPIAYAAVTIDGQPLGGAGEGECVTGWVGAGEHLVEAVGDIGGMTVTGTLSITGV